MENEILEGGGGTIGQQNRKWWWLCGGGEGLWGDIQSVRFYGP